MSKVTGRLLVAVIVLLAVSNWFFARRATAKPQIVYGQPACTTYVPASWGEYVGSSEHYGMVFKDNAGTLRFLTNIPCETVPQIALQVKRTNSPN
jgi:hypothetical protein